MFCASLCIKCSCHEIIRFRINFLLVYSMLIGSLEIVPLDFFFLRLIMLEIFELFTGKEDGCCVGGDCWCRRSALAAVPHPFHFAGAYTCLSTSFPYELWRILAGISTRNWYHIPFPRQFLLHINTNKIKLPQFDWSARQTRPFVIMNTATIEVSNNLL